MKKNYYRIQESVQDLQDFSSLSINDNNEKSSDNDNSQSEDQRNPETDHSNENKGNDFLKFDTQEENKTVVDPLDDKKEEKEEKEEDNYLDDPLALDDNQEDNNDKENTNNDEIFSSLVQELELDIEENQSIDKELFIEKINSKIEDARKEYKTDGYSPEALMVLEHIEQNGGHLSDFSNDSVITDATNYIKMNDNDLYRLVRQDALEKAGLDSEEIENMLENEIENYGEKYVKMEANKYREQLTDLRDSRLEEIHNRQAKYKESQEKIKEQQTMRDLKKMTVELDKMQDFLGLELSDKNKEKIKDQILNNKNFLKQLNEPKTQLEGYLYKTFAKRAVEYYAKMIHENNIKGYNKAMEKHIKEFYNIDPKGQAQSMQTTSERTSKIDLSDLGRMFK